jgi:Na+/H+-dicarboxylate symporter
MAQRPLRQLVIGSAIGHIAGVFSAIGTALFYLTLESEGRLLAFAAAVLLALMMIIEGVYHAVYTLFFAFSSQIADEPIRDALISLVRSLRCM